MTSPAPHPLDAIEPQNTRTVTVLGKPWTVRPLRIGQIPAFSRALARAGSLTGVLAGDIEPDQIFALIGEHGDAFIDATQIALGAPRENLEQCEPDEFIACVAAIIAVNLDFFARQLTPALLARLHEVAGPNGAGLTPSTP